jgi:hypothetical protein
VKEEKKRKEKKRKDFFLENGGKKFEGTFLFLYTHARCAWAISEISFIPPLPLLLLTKTDRVIVIRQTKKEKRWKKDLV